jgi:hypothetical protein
MGRWQLDGRGNAMVDGAEQSDTLSQEREILWGIIAAAILLIAFMAVAFTAAVISAATGIGGWAVGPSRVFSFRDAYTTVILYMQFSLVPRVVYGEFVLALGLKLVWFLVYSWIFCRTTTLCFLPRIGRFRAGRLDSLSEDFHIGFARRFLRCPGALLVGSFVVAQFAFLISSQAFIEPARNTLGPLRSLSEDLSGVLWFVPNCLAMTLAMVLLYALVARTTYALTASLPDSRPALTALVLSVLVIAPIAIGYDLLFWSTRELLDVVITEVGYMFGASLISLDVGESFGSNLIQTACSIALAAAAAVGLIILRRTFREEQATIDRAIGESKRLC